jgi:hypothetical protein
MDGGSSPHQLREQLVEFIKLWSLIKNINLGEDENDHIQWKWMPMKCTPHCLSLAIPRLLSALSNGQTMESED